MVQVFYSKHQQFWFFSVPKKNQMHFTIELWSFGKFNLLCVKRVIKSNLLFIMNVLNHYSFLQLTVSRLFFPFIRTVSPRKSCNSSILVWIWKTKVKVKVGNGRIEHTETCTQRTGRMIHCSSFLSLQTWDIATTELSSLIASSTNKRLGRDLFFNIAVASSSLSQRKVTGSGPCRLQFTLRNGKS